MIALLTFTVAGALLGVSVVYNTPGSLDARYGTADMLIRYGAADPQELNSQVASARAQLGTVDVIGHRSATIPGLTRPVEVRAQDPHGPYGATMLRLVSGRYPAAAGEAAVTDEVAALMRLRVGGQLTLADRTWSVVGVVENPHDLNAEFVLVSPAGADPPESVTILSMGPPSRIIVDQGAPARPSRPAKATHGPPPRRTRSLWWSWRCSWFAWSPRPRSSRWPSAGCDSSACSPRPGRRERHVRLVMLAAGALAGTAAAVLGTVVAAPLWIVAIPRLEPAVGHRIEASQPALVADRRVPAAGRGHRHRGRLVARAGGCPHPDHPGPLPAPAAPDGRPAAGPSLGLLLMAAGVACLRLGSDNAALVVAGSAATLAGLPLLAPLAIRGLARAGARLAGCRPARPA